MVVAKKYVYVKDYTDGLPKKENFKVVEEKLPPLKNGEFVVEAVYFSIDPFMRTHKIKEVKVGEEMAGEQVGKIIESKSSKFPVGKYVSGFFGWRTHTVVSENFKSPIAWGDLTLINFADQVPASLALGALGMPGHTAYIGVVEFLKPKPGDVLVITGAAGAVGNHVGQLGKIKGLTVIGIAGSDSKNEWLKSVGFDHVINYKTQDVGKTLDKLAPKGVNLYFDNVGGEISSTIISKMALRGRIVVCGAISAYMENETPKATIVQQPILYKELTMKGLFIGYWNDRFDECISQNLQWIKEGKLKYKETITVGFENMVEALVGLLKGENTGKAIVKV